MIILRTFKSKIDELNRITLPLPIMDRLGVSPGNSISYTISNGKVSIIKTVPCCALCGAAGNLNHFRNQMICSGCLKEISSVCRRLEIP